MADKCVINKSTLTDIANSIRSKNGSSDTYLPSEMSQAIDNIPSGETEIDEKDVNFYRPDGKLLYSFTKEEVLADDWQMPEQPDWEVVWNCKNSVDTIPMTKQGWNWSREDLIDYVSDYGMQDVDAIYIPTDRKTHILLSIVDDYRLTQPLCYKQSVANGVYVDWGDGSEKYSDTTTSHIVRSHTYQGRGNYHISLEVKSGTLTFGGSSNLTIIGNPAQSTTIPARVFSSRISSILIGGSISSLFGIGTYTFQYCYSLTRVSIPNSITSIGAYAFQNCYAITRVSIPNSITSIGTSAFSACYTLQRVSIPNSVTLINSYTFQNCYAITRVSIPNSITSIGTNAFYYCYGIIKYDFTTNTQIPDLSNVNAFSNIAKDCQIVVPDALYDSWITAYNWSNASIVSHIIKESEYDCEI